MRNQDVIFLQQQIKKKKLSSQSNQIYSLWVFSDPHTKKGIDESSDMLQTAISQINAGAFDFDFALCLGDFAAGTFPMDATSHATEGENNASRLQALSKGRSSIYTLAGNHDAGDEEMLWFNKYIDPLGDNSSDSGVVPANMPYDITTMDTDTWHSYYITFGNWMVIMLSDRNDLPQPYGRENGSGGYPTGTITQETWDWVEDLLTNNTDKNIIICSHHLPRNTAIGSSDNHGYKANFNSVDPGLPGGEGSIYSLYDAVTPDDATSQITDYFANNSGHTCRLWMACHEHTRIGHEFDGRMDRFFQDGVLYMNVACITNTWYNGSNVPHSKSWKIDLDDASLTLKMYLHEAIKNRSIGFQDDVEQTYIFGEVPSLVDPYQDPILFLSTTTLYELIANDPVTSWLDIVDDIEFLNDSGSNQFQFYGTVAPFYIRVVSDPNDYLESPDFFSLVLGDIIGTVIAVLKTQNNYVGPFLCFDNAAEDHSDYLQFRTVCVDAAPHDNCVEIDLKIDGTRSRILTPVDSITPGSVAVVTIQSTGSEYVIRINGVEQSLTVNTGSNNGDWIGDITDLAKCYIGKNPTVTNAYFDLYNLLYYDSVLTEAQMQVIEDILMENHRI